MSNPFVAEIRIFPFNFAPKGWAFCDGQILPLSQNTALFSLLGTNYGGDGKSNFALPNLQGSVAMHTTQYSGSSPFGSFSIGETGGEDYVTLLTSEMPIAHAHGAGRRRQQQRGVQLAQRRRPGQRQAEQHVFDLDHAAARVDEPGDGERRWRQPAAQQPDAVPDAELLHRASGRLPASHVTPRRNNERVDTVYVGDQDHVVQLRAEGLGDVQRTAPADKPESSALLAARDDVRRRRTRQFRAAEPAGPRWRSTWGAATRSASAAAKKRTP